MKDPWAWVFLLIILALIATCAQGCSSQDWVQAEAKRSFTETYQKCLMGYRAAQWPKVVHFPNGDHPCTGCYVQRNAADCRELARVGI